MAADAQAYLPVDLEAAGGRQEAEGWRAQRVRGRQYDAAMVDAVLEGGGGWAAQCEMPVEQIGVGGGRRVEIG